MITITLEKILKEFSLTELENIVFKNKPVEEHFLSLAEIESTEFRNEWRSDSHYSN